MLAELTEQKNRRIAELEAALSEKSRSIAECLDLADSGDKIYAIYHQAESSNFGVYELVSGKIRTVCADAFVVSQAGRYSKDRCTYYPPSRRSFTTYFDEASVNKGERKSCQF